MPTHAHPILPRRTFLTLAATAAASALLAACGAAKPATIAPAPLATPAATTAPLVATMPVPLATMTTGTVPAVPAATTTKATTTVRAAFSYIPNVQFAPFYVADARGRFAAENLRVEYDYGTTTDFMQLVARGERDFLNASGDEVILARAAGVPVVYIAAVYQQYPVAIFAPKGKGLTDAQSLTKLRVGLPGFFGATYIGYKAILYSAKIDEKAVNAQEIGFTQTQSVQSGKVDAAVGYANNEPVQLRAKNFPVDTLRVSDVFDLPSAGIVTSEKMLADKPEIVRGFLRGLLAGMRDTQRDPNAAFADVVKIVPEAQKTADVQQQVLNATVELSGDPATYGAINPALWSRAVTFMKETALLKGDPKPEQMYSTAFLPK